MKFSDLGLLPQILLAAQEAGYQEPSPIQQKAIGSVLEGRDLIGCAQTGTGKTAAFAMPILQLLASHPWKDAGKKPVRALILTPTRELALQIEESFGSYGRHLSVTHQVIFGGVPQKPQEQALAKGIEVLVATPCRLNDLVNQKLLTLSSVEIFVLDEADRMLDMGFLPDVKRVLAVLPKKRQTLLFSATMPKEIRDLATSMLHNPVQVSVNPVSSTVDRIEQQVYFVDRQNKRKLLTDLLADPEIHSALVFVRTKHGADRVAQDLNRAGIRAAAIHGDKSQGQRQAALSRLKEGSMRVLVATDIAARGIDIEDLSHVINFDLPNVPETYVHRIGRTGRAGMSGRAVSFCDFEEKVYLADIEKLIKKKITVVQQHPYPMEVFEPTAKPARSDRSAKGERSERGRLSEINQPKKTEIPLRLEKQEPITHQERIPQQEKRQQQTDSHQTSGKEQLKRESATASSSSQLCPKREQSLPKTSPQEKKELKKLTSAPVLESVSLSLSERGTPKRPAQEEAKLQQVKTVDSMLTRGLPTIRDDGKKKIRLENREVNGYDELPKPPAGSRLLTSFADTGVEYRLAEDPNADQSIFETLGFYRPPEDAMERIFGKNYQILDEEGEKGEEPSLEKTAVFQNSSQGQPLSSVTSAPFSEKQPEDLRKEFCNGSHRRSLQPENSLERQTTDSSGQQKKEKTAVSQGKKNMRQPSKTPEFHQEKTPGIRKEERIQNNRRHTDPKRKEKQENKGNDTIKTRSQQLWYADTVVPPLKEVKSEHRRRRPKPSSRENQE